tara:strand:- start:631 stop:1215 length:585 start_codon:yes stop_codon:yes gene_type:complete
MNITFTHQEIKDAFCDLDLPEEGYNNQGFYMQSAQRIRYVLVTMELAPYESTLFTEDNKFYNCISFGYKQFPYLKDVTWTVNNPELLQELIDMDEDALEQYVNTNGYDWLGDDFDHMNEYLNFASEMNDEFYFEQGDICNDSEYMEINKFPWIRDKVNGYKSENKYEVAYHILLENAQLTNDIKDRLIALEVRY